MSQRDSAHHVRATPRFKLFQPTEMIASGAIRRVHILDLSAGGALVHAPDPPAPKTPLQLRCGNETRSARVAWVDQHRFGITFTIPLSDERVEELIAEQEALIAAASQRLVAGADRSGSHEAKPGHGAPSRLARPESRSRAAVPR